MQSAPFARKRIRRGKFFSLGVVLLISKMVLDWIISTQVFNRPYLSPLYFFPRFFSEPIALQAVGESNYLYLATLAAATLPFIAVGVVLVLWRLNDINGPRVLALLKFSVTESPPPLEEWNPFRKITPPHLNGFFRSRAGQFKLSALGPARTKLEGTTWYQHEIWPSWSWKIFSERAIGFIHRRVLAHIKSLSESF